MLLCWFVCKTFLGTLALIDINREIESIPKTLVILVNIGGIEIKVAN